MKPCERDSVMAYSTVERSDVYMKKKPNILIILMDTQQVRNMTPYGYEKDTTPNIQTIAL